MRTVPALWELYDGKRLVGWVEKTYSGRRPWSAVHTDHHDEIGRFRSRRDAVNAIKKHDARESL